MKQSAIVIDLDGTLVDSSHREPYDYEKIMDDKVIMPVADMMGGNYLNIFSRINIILTGRSNDCFEKTVQWLTSKGLRIHRAIFNEDKENQVVFKEKEIKKLMEEYNILYCIDDNPEVVKMFKSLGLKAYSIL